MIFNALIGLFTFIGFLVVFLWFCGFMEWGHFFFYFGEEKPIVTYDPPRKQL